MAEPDNDKERKKPGPPEPRLVIEEDWEEAAGRLIRTPVPPGGVPKPEKKRERGTAREHPDET